MKSLRVFDADPAESGLGPFAVVQFRVRPERALQRVACALRRADGYAPGDALWGLWEDETGRCRQVRHVLTRVRP